MTSKEAEAQSVTQNISSTRDLLEKFYSERSEIRRKIQVSAHQVFKELGIFSTLAGLLRLSKEDNKAEIKWIIEPWRDRPVATAMLFSDWKEPNTNHGHIFGVAITTRGKRPPLLISNHVAYENPAGIYAYFLKSGLKRPYNLADLLGVGRVVKEDLLYIYKNCQPYDFHIEEPSIRSSVYQPRSQSFMREPNIFGDINDLERNEFSEISEQEWDSFEEEDYTVAGEHPMDGCHTYEDGSEVHDRDCEDAPSY